MILVVAVLPGRNANKNFISSVCIKNVLSVYHAGWSCPWWFIKHAFKALLFSDLRKFVIFCADILHYSISELRCVIDCWEQPLINQECLHLLLRLINFIFGSEFAEIFLARFWQRGAPGLHGESPGELVVGRVGICGSVGGRGPGGGRPALRRQIVDSRSINLHNCQ